MKLFIKKYDWHKVIIKDIKLEITNILNIVARFSCVSKKPSKGGVKNKKPLLKKSI